MDVGALASAFISAQAGQMQLAIATKVMRMNIDAQKSVLTLLNAGNASLDPLANVAAGVGGNLDISV